MQDAERNGQSGEESPEEPRRQSNGKMDGNEMSPALEGWARRLLPLRTLDELALEVGDLLRDRLPFSYGRVYIRKDSLKELIPVVAWNRQRVEAGLDGLTGQNAPRQGVVPRTIQSGRSARVANVVEEDDALPLFIDSRAELCVPLRVGEQVFGALDLQSTDVAAYDEGHQRLLEALSEPIAVALDNSLRYERSRRRAVLLEANVISRTSKLEQQYRRQAALAKVELAINEPHELQEVLDRVAEVTTEHLPASGGAMVILWDTDEKMYYVGATTVPGQPPRGAAPHIRQQSGATHWIIQNRQALVVPNVRDDPFGANRLVTVYFNQAYAGTPLIAGNSVVGVLYALDKEPRNYSQEDLNFLNALANRAAAAISKVKLFESERKQRRLAETLRAANLAMTESLNLETVLDSLLVLLETLVPYDSASVMLVRDDGEIQIQAARGYDRHIDPEELREIRFNAYRHRTFRTILSDHRSLIIHDTQRYQGWESGMGTDFIRSWMGVPMITGGRVIGFYSIDKHSPGFFTEEHQVSAEALAAQGALAIQNALLFGDVQRLATIDVLTGINNRRRFYELAEREYQRARRYQRPVAAIMLDIDHFKQVNDSHGHAVGDQVLQALAGVLQRNLRDIDILGRYGGEEFTVLLPESDAGAAAGVAERLRKRIEALNIATDRGSIEITISLGVASVVADSEEEYTGLDRLIDRADRAMLEGKELGGNVVRIYREEENGE